MAANIRKIGGSMPSELSGKVCIKMQYCSMPGTSQTVISSTTIKDIVTYNNIYNSTTDTWLTSSTDRYLILPMIGQYNSDNIIMYLSKTFVENYQWTNSIVNRYKKFTPRILSRSSTSPVDLFQENNVMISCRFSGTSLIIGGRLVSSGNTTITYPVIFVMTFSNMPSTFPPIL